jgi:hypothetical protein
MYLWGTMSRFNMCMHYVMYLFMAKILKILSSSFVKHTLSLSTITLLYQNVIQHHFSLVPNHFNTLKKSLCSLIHYSLFPWSLPPSSGNHKNASCLSGFASPVH